MRKVLLGLVVLVLVLGIAWVSFNNERNNAGFPEQVLTTIESPVIAAQTREGNPPEIILFEVEKGVVYESDSEICYRLLVSDETDVKLVWVEYDNAIDEEFSWWIKGLEEVGPNVWEAEDCVALRSGKEKGLYAVSSLYVSDSYSNDKYYMGEPFCSVGDSDCIPDGENQITIAGEPLVLPTVTPRPLSKSPILLPSVGG